MNLTIPEDGEWPCIVRAPAWDYSITTDGDARGTGIRKLNLVMKPEWDETDSGSREPSICITTKILTDILFTVVIYNVILPEKVVTVQEQHVEI